MSFPQSLATLLATGAADAPAIGAPSRRTLTHGELRELVATTAARLQALGAKHGDRIAIVLANGAEMATCFLSVASCACAAPLNPGYREDEFRFYLGDLGARLLVVMRGADSPARTAAQALGIPIVELVPEVDGPAGRFQLATHQGNGLAVAGAEAASVGAAAGPEDVALLLHTSGTTARPKLVPLTQRNLCASADAVSRTLALDPADRALGIMPLFHIHGLVAGLLAPLAAGSSVFCAPGFDALKFFAWMDEWRPTWYSAVPTMHQAILARAGRNEDIVRRNRLRLLRSSSSAIPPSVAEQLEAVFGAPLVEAYGMTEAAHQMASNPLPPAPRKPGSVGLPAGAQIALLDAAGSLLPRGTTGEIAVRGPGVTAGYLGNPAANAAAFAEGWFRTGDQGYMDADGYLFVTGRLKEIINRGGEKISPREVEEALLAHPGVVQAVAFAIPHARLGEEVGAAVVLADGAASTDAEIRAFVATHLADFKVPARLLILGEIPKGPTGKPQRIGLAARLGLA